MRCKQGKLALIIKSLHAANLGKPVITAELIGYIDRDNPPDYRGQTLRVPISDYYWWIVSETSPIETAFGPTSRAACPDTWLLPIEGDPVDDDKETERNDELVGENSN